MSCNIPTIITCKIIINRIIPEIVTKSITKYNKNNENLIVFSLKLTIRAQHYTMNLIECHTLCYQERL